jgi:glycosyltransferase involved in cell wall biosynthesis
MPPMAPRASVLLSTYNQPHVLDLALHGYARQSTQDFEIVIGDDGSGSETAELIARHQRSLPVPLLHAWQPNRGFRKAKAMNRAALKSRGAWLIFSDGDCIPSRTFVEEHLAAAREGRYIVGGHLRLSAEETRALTADDVRSGRFERLGTPLERANLWLTHWRSLVYIALRKRRKPKFYGLNFSLSRDTFFGVNGLDSTFAGSGKEDSDLRNRLQLAGARATSLWHRARVYHQYHPPHNARLAWREAGAYYNRDDLKPEAPDGLRELAAEIAAERPTG